MFKSALIDNDLTKPNERYFIYLDNIINKAKEYGFCILLPVWGQLVVSDNWMGEVFEKIVNEYGEFIVKRYGKQNHILWCLGGDRQPIHKGCDYKKVWKRIAEGLAKGVLGKELKYNVKDESWNDLLITYHACHEQETGECSTLSYWNGEEEAWIRFVMIQSGHSFKPKKIQVD